MKQNLIKLMPVVISILFMACSPSTVPFTQQLREQYHLSPDELRAIQFYTSNTFVLRRGETGDKKETTNGELTVLKDAKVEEIIIKAGTPCVIKEVVDGNRVTVSFNQGGNQFLVFGSLNNRDGYYTLMALDWKSGKGKVNYGEQTYMTSVGSKDVFLVLKMKNLDQFKLDTKIEKGVELK